MSATPRLPEPLLACRPIALRGGGFGLRVGPLNAFRPHAVTVLPA